MDYPSAPEYMKVSTKIYVEPRLTEIPVDITLAKTVNKAENGGHPSGNAGASS